MERAEVRPLPSRLGAALFHPWTWRMAWRDSRTQRKRLATFSLSIVSGMAALVAIHALKASVERGIETQAKALLGSICRLPPVSHLRRSGGADHAAGEPICARDKLLDDAHLSQGRRLAARAGAGDHR
jgi:hypothetical protein